MKAKPNAQNSTAEARVDDALLEDVDHFTGAGEAGVEEPEAQAFGSCAELRMTSFAIVIRSLLIDFVSLAQD
jgi:hypothetical protein